MAYVLLLDRVKVIPYLRDLRLSRQSRIKLFAALSSLRESADLFIKDPSRRLAKDSPFFVFDYVLQDKEGDGGFHHYWFVISDAAAEYGVLRVVYAEELGTS